MFVVDEYPLGTVMNACYLCKASKRPGERLVDTGVQIDFEGWLVFCQSCISDAASMLGLLSSDQAGRLHDKIDRLSAKANEYKIRAETAEAAVDALRRLDALKQPAQVTSGN